MPRPSPFSVTLVTPGDMGLRESGTGFVVDHDEATGDAYVATCSHVVRDWKASVHVNGKPAQILQDGDPVGMDVAILKVPDMGGAVPLDLASLGVRSGATVYRYCFQHLHGTDYVRARVEGPPAEPAGALGRAARGGLGGGTPQGLPGNSGSPLIEAKSHRVVGILSHVQKKDGRGIAISTEALRLLWPALARDPARPPGGADEAPPETPLPQPDPPAPTHPEDPQKDRFGSKTERSGRSLSAELTDTKDPNYFYVDFVVQSTDGSALEGPARFFLHDTFPREIVSIRKPEKTGVLALRDVYSYGVFTVGCQVRDKAGRWTSLELDLARLSGMPKRFLDR